MTELLYLADIGEAYVTRFRARIVALPPGGVVLDRTRFYPTGGGQPCDLGTLQRADGSTLAVTDVSKSGDAVLMSAADFDSWQETIYLLRSPANARRLMEAVARDKSHQPAVVKTVEELQALAGE